MATVSDMTLGQHAVASYATPGRFFDDRRRPLFDSAFYWATNPDIRNSNRDPYEHYCLIGRYEGRRPSLHSPFDKNALPAPPRSPHADWLREQKAVVVRSQLFDSDWYADLYALDASEALDHFVTEGAYVGCDPNPFFSTVAYLLTAHDVLRAGANPLAHYVTYGYVEIERGLRADPFPSRFILNEKAWRSGQLETFDYRSAFGT